MLHIANLALSIDAEELKRFVDEKYPVTNVQTWEQRPYAFVELRHEDDLFEAVRSLNGSTFQGSVISVRPSHRYLQNKEGLCYYCGSSRHFRGDCPYFDPNYANRSQSRATATSSEDNSKDSSSSTSRAGKEDADDREERSGRRPSRSRSPSAYGRRRDDLPTVEQRYFDRSPRRGRSPSYYSDYRSHRSRERSPYRSDSPYYRRSYDYDRRASPRNDDYRRRDDYDYYDRHPRGRRDYSPDYRRYRRSGSPYSSDRRRDSPSTTSLPTDTKRVESTPPNKPINAAPVSTPDAKTTPTATPTTTPPNLDAAEKEMDSSSSSPKAD